MRVRILGPLAVETEVGPVEVAGARLRALLVRLALDAGRPVGAGALTAAVWGDEPPDDAANALQSLVSRLRRALPEPGLVGSGPAGYRLELAADDVDALRFERLAHAARGNGHAPDPAGTLDLVTEALALWRGPALADQVGPPFAPARARLEELRLGAEEARADALLALGRAGEAVPVLETLAAEHPLREGLAERLVLALHRSGRRAEALAAYEQARSRIADRLGVDPSPGLRAAQLEVLRADAETGPPADPAGNASASADQHGPGPDGPRGRLPARVTSFVGRQAELSRVHALLAEHRLVTLVGPGGAGKTRLSVEAAAALDPAPDDGAWLVELAPWSSPDDVPQAVLGSISLRASSLLDSGTGGTGYADALARLVDGLAGRDLLLVLDNCEHLVDAAAGTVDHLLARCPRLRVLATSREPLGVYGEALLPLAPLGRPEPGTAPAEALATPAVRLFADRAAAVDPGFRVDDGTVAAVVELCRRLDGLPLAIELAAARTRTLPVQVLADRLDDRFRLLTGGARTAAPRHQTLRAVVAWSWDLLDDAERDLLERCAVFAGSADLDAVAALAAAGQAGAPADPVEVLDRVGSLVDKSLLVRAEGPRWRMLETIREFGLERLAARGVAAEVRRAHVEHYLALAERAEPELRRADQVRWLARLGADRDNLHAALRYASEAGHAALAIRLGAALAWYWTILGDHADAVTWLRVAFGTPGADDPDGDVPDEAWAVAGVVWAISLMESGAAAEAAARAGLFADRLPRIDLLSGHPLLGMAEPGLALIQDDEARARQALRRNLSHPDPWARAFLQLLTAVIAENAGDLDEARLALPAALDGFRELGERWGTAMALSMLGAVRSLDGEVAGAIAAFEEAMRLMGELNATDDVTFVLVRLSGLRRRAGDLPGARADAERAARVAARSGSSTAEASAQVALAELDRYGGDRESARALTGRALALVQDGEGRPDQAGALVHAAAARLELDDGRPDLAAPLLGRAWALAVGSRDMPVTALVGVGLALLVEAGGDPAGAARMVLAADVLRGAPEVGDPDLAALLSRLRTALGEPALAALRAEAVTLTRDSALALLAAAAPT